MRTLCLGECLVDLVCERPVASLGDADAFVPHFGGAVANVAVVAARLGAPVTLAGGAGDDAWGTFLRERLERAGVDLSAFALVPGIRTPVAFVAVDATGEPDYLIYGDAIAATVDALGDGVRDLVDAHDALFFSSNTLTGPAERAVTHAARERALDADRKVLIDVNLRLHRWETELQAASAAMDVVPGAFLVKCNREEARILTGHADPAAAAEALLGKGAEHVLITLGPDGALLRGGGMRVDVPGVPAQPVDATGAGDTLMAHVIARLAVTGGYAPAIAAALPDAVEAAARVTERWGAVD